MIAIDCISCPGSARFHLAPVRRLLCGAIFLAAGTGLAQAADPLTLEGAVMQALQANPQLQARRSAHDAQSLEQDIARGQRYPALDLGASYNRYSDPYLVHPIDDGGVFPPLDTDIVNAGLSLRLPLYAGGKLVAGESLASHDTQSALAQLQGSEQDLIFNVVATYAKVLQLDDLYEAQVQRLRSLASEAEEITRKIEEGRATRLEALRVQAQQSRAQFDQAATAQGERDARSLLAAFMDRSVLDTPLAVLPALSFKAPESAELAARRAGEKNPQVLQARAQLGSAEDRVTIAHGERRPQLDLVANTQTRRGGDWEGRDDWDVGVILSMPLFDAGVRRSRIDQASLERLQSQQQLRGIVNEVTTEARAAIGGLRTARAQMNAARQGLAEAEEAMRIESLRYRSGRSTITDLLSAESAQWAAVASLNQAEYDEFVARVRLLKALGELTPEVFDGDRETTRHSQVSVAGAP